LGVKAKNSQEILLISPNDSHCVIPVAHYGLRFPVLAYHASGLHLLVCFCLPAQLAVKYPISDFTIRVSRRAGTETPFEIWRSIVSAHL